MKKAYLTPGEFELMEVLWSVGEASVRKVWESVRTRRAVAYTTVMTVLFKMHQKGAVSQRKVGKAYLYAPLIDREQVLEGVIDHLRDTYFGGSPQEMQRFIARGKAQAAGSAPEPGADHTPASLMDEFLL